VVVQGGVFDLESWAPQAVLAKSYRVVAYSQRYSWPNKNRIQPNYSRVVDADDLAALITKLNLGPVHVVGASSGGATAVMLAIAHPEMIRSLVLIEPPLLAILRDVPGTEATIKAFDAAVIKPTYTAFEKGDNEAALMIFTNGVWGKRKWADLSSLEQSAIRRNAQAMRARLQAPPLPSPTLKAQLSGLDLPTLIVTGENSVTLHKMMDDELARCMPKARQVTIPQAGHTSPHDNPEAFNAELLAFWAAIKH
jgi:pimeloyl-ACP methyl ester carboxylesterase